MIDGIYTTASGMYPRGLDQEIAANNLANINTTGFKKDAVHFKRMLDSQLSLAEQLGNDIGDQDVQEVLINFSQGELMQTNNPLDLAIEGDGFFVVLTPDGEKYTRNGHFSMNAEGEVISADGYPVVGKSGLISLLPENFEINSNGEILQNNAIIDQFKIVDFPKPYPLRKEGQNIFMLTNNVRENEDPENVSIKQGYLETSNVNPISEMIKLITNSKSFQAGQRSIHYQDRTLDKAVNSVGKY